MAGRPREATINKESEIREAIDSAKTIAVVGCSPNPARPSHSIALYLQDSGYRVIPVNPGHRELIGEKCYPSIEAIPADVRIDIVDVFRTPDTLPAIAREAVAIGGRTEALNAQADTFADLGEVLALAGRRKDAAEATERALARYEAKENLVMAGRMRERLAAVRAEVG